MTGNETVQLRTDPPWEAIRERFLAALAEDQRQPVLLLLRQPCRGGTGLRQWLSALAEGIALLPEHLPRELIDVYLRDPEAMPLHDCAGCGLAIPVRAARGFAEDEEAGASYFPTCPACGGRTGRFARLSSLLKRPRALAPA